MVPSGGGFKAYGTNVQAIVYDKNTDLFMECIEGPKRPMSYNISGKSYDFSDSLYVILKFEFQVYVSLDLLVGALRSGQRVFLISPGNSKLKHTISFSAAYGFLNNIPYNLLSADHCQEGTEKIISDIVVCYGNNC
jgi:hypothetical protein